MAFVCAARGFPITVVTSDAFSREKRDHMRALGATVLEIASHHGRTTKELIQRMIAKATELSAEPGSFFADQFNNLDAAAGYAPLAEEVWEQTGGRIDAFVQSVGTAQCISGVGRVLRERTPGVEIVGPMLVDLNSPLAWSRSTENLFRNPRHQHGLACPTQRS